MLLISALIRATSPEIIRSIPENAAGIIKNVAMYVPAEIIAEVTAVSARGKRNASIRSVTRSRTAIIASPFNPPFISERLISIWIEIAIANTMQIHQRQFEKLDGENIDESIVQMLFGISKKKLSNDTFIMSVPSNIMVAYICGVKNLTDSVTAKPPITMGATPIKKFPI